MTDQHLRRTELPDFDAPTTHYGMNTRVADLRRGRVIPIPGGERAAPSANTCLRAEAR